MMKQERDFFWFKIPNYITEKLNTTFDVLREFSIQDVNYNKIEKGFTTKNILSLESCRDTFIELLIHFSIDKKINTFLSNKRKKFIITDIRMNEYDKEGFDKFHVYKDSKDYAFLLILNNDDSNHILKVKEKSPMKNILTHVESRVYIYPAKYYLCSEPIKKGLRTVTGTFKLVPYKEKISNSQWFLEYENHTKTNKISIANILQNLKNISIFKRGLKHGKHIFR